MTPVTRTVTIQLDPEELARLFADMFADEQAEFFAHVWEFAKAWPAPGWCFQALNIVDSLTPAGKETIQALADHLSERSKGETK